jgi:hypothetical protein
MITVQAFTPAMAYPRTITAAKQPVVLPQQPPAMPHEEDEFVSTTAQVRSGAKNPLKRVLLLAPLLLPSVAPVVDSMAVKAETKIAQVRQAPILIDPGPILKVPSGQVNALKQSLACEPVAGFSGNEVALVGRSMVVSPNGRSSAVLVPAGTYEASFGTVVDGTYQQLLNKCNRVLANINTQLSNGKVGVDINGTISLPTAVNDRQGFVSIGQGNLYLKPSTTTIAWGGQPPKEVWKFTAPNGESFVTPEPVKNQPNRQKPVDAPRG